MKSFMMCSRYNHHSDNQIAEDEIGGICDMCRGRKMCLQSFRGKTECTSFWRPKSRWEVNTRLTPNEYDAWPRFISVVIGHEWCAIANTVMNLREFLV